MAAQVSVIVPTIGRPKSIGTLLDSLARQTAVPREILIADASATSDTASVVSNPVWLQRGLAIRHLRVSPPNAVRQRVAAIDASHGDYLLLLDDDVELQPNCIEEMLRGMQSAPDVVAVVADFSNQHWSGPTRAWRLYMRVVLGLRDGEWEGRVVGPLLRFGFNSSRERPAIMEWIGGGNTLVTRIAYDASGGFSEFFLYRSTLHEDVDLGIKLRRQGVILFWPEAKLAHYHEPTGRVAPRIAAEGDVFNRYQVMRRTLKRSAWRCLQSLALYIAVETASDIYGLIRGRRKLGDLSRTFGRLVGFGRVLDEWRRPVAHRG